MRVVGVIPARFASTRFPGKLLKQLVDKPILQWVIELVSKCKSLDDFYVATDHEDIFNLCQILQVKVIMTSVHLTTGTDRIYEALQKIPACDIIVNIQGDEPLLPIEYVDLIVSAMKNNPSVSMATLAHPLSILELENKNSVKVIVNKNNEAIYFSRFPIPFSREVCNEKIVSCVQKHIGLYGYKTAFLKEFCDTPISFLEKNESLEQLRALEMGAKIKVISVDQPTFGIDSEKDLLDLERKLRDEKK